MKHLHVNTKVLTFILFFLLLLPSCNNEEIFVVEESAIIAEETEEETPNTEDEVIPIDAVDDTVFTTENSPVDIEAYLNDINLPESVTISNTNPSNGVLAINNNETPDNLIDDTVVYTPNAGFSGMDSFDYTVCDATNAENCDTATVTITIEPIDVTDVSGELKAFPTAYGGGAYATGGRGGNVYHVTNLNNDGTGSFRWAVGQSRPATIVFDVSGTIALTDYMVIQGKDLTIAGQTAPVGGITFTFSNPNHRFRFWNVENMIVRYIRLRYQRDNNVIGLDIYGNGTIARNLIFDHVSISYAGWTGVGLRGSNSNNVTFQNSIIAECKTGAIYGDSDTSHYSKDNSFNGNFFYNVSHRFPNPNSDGRIDVINNVIQNYYFRQCSNTHAPKLNHINNYTAAGKHSSIGFDDMNRAFESKDNEIYSAGNIIDNSIFTDPAGDNKLIWSKWDRGSETQYLAASEFVDTMHPLIGAAYPIRTATQAYNDVITYQDLGASKSINANGTISDSRDANDLAYFAKTAEGEGAYESYTTGNAGTDRSFFFEQRYFNFLASISSTPVNARPESYDSDDDGMADVWETNTFGDLTKTANGDEDGDGYTNIEEFIYLVDSQ